MIFIVKVSTNKEDKVLDMIEDRVKKKKLQIWALARPHRLRGYIILESLDRENAEKACYGVPYVKGILRKKVDYKEIENLLEPTPEQINIKEGDIVEIIAEAFKRDKAKVIRVDKQKGEAVVELLEATVPIPTVLKIDNLKVIRREEKEKTEGEKILKE